MRRLNVFTLRLCAPAFRLIGNNYVYNIQDTIIYSVIRANGYELTILDHVYAGLKGYVYET